MAKSRKSRGKKGRQKGGAGLFLLLFTGLAWWALPEFRTELTAGGAVLVCFLLWGALRRGRIASTMGQIDAMGGHGFERFLVQLFKRLGYKTKHVGGSGGDFGADLIVEKNGLRTAVQAKNYGKSAVGNDAVQQAIAGAAYYDCQEALVVTNSRFTKAAREQAGGSNLPVHLWDRKILEQKLKA
jgi:restriction system protein